MFFLTGSLVVFAAVPNSLELVGAFHGYFERRRKHTSILVGQWETKAELLSYIHISHLHLD